MAAGDLELLRRAWDAFACGDLEAVAEILHPDVRWYGAGERDEPGGCHNRGEALAFIRGALDDGVTSELLDLREAGDRVVVILRTHAPVEWGEARGPHGEIVTVRDGKVVEMVVYPTVDEALAAARA
jgi:ketosteroid isomerase-like protein